MPLTGSIALILAIVAAVGFVALMSYRSLVALSPWRRVLTTGLRAVLVLLLLLVLWQRTEPVVISIQGPWRWCLHAALLASLFGFVWGVRSLDAFDALGVQALLPRSGSKPPQPMPLAVHGAYRWVRHPLYTSSLLLLWSQPDLTYDRLLFNLSWSGWIILGCYLEERDLRATFGQAYARYQQEVPMLIPWRIPRHG